MSGDCLPLAEHDDRLRPRACRRRSPPQQRRPKPRRSHPAHRPGELIMHATRRRFLTNPHWFRRRRPVVAERPRPGGAQAAQFRSAYPRDLDRRSDPVEPGSGAAEQQQADRADVPGDAARRPAAGALPSDRPGDHRYDLHAAQITSADFPMMALTELPGTANSADDGTRNCGRISTSSWRAISRTPRSSCCGIRIQRA